MSLSAWDIRFMDIAKSVSEWSPDPSTKVGAIVVSDQNLILAFGWNAFPRKVTSIKEDGVEREVKYKYIIHAEANTIYNSTRNGISLLGSTLYVYGIPPCLDCGKAIVQVGVRRVISIVKDNIRQSWLDSYDNTKKLFAEVGIEEAVYDEKYKS